MTSFTVTIGNRKIGPGEPCYLIAEVGTTCMGEIDKAFALVDAAAAAGVDAVKFQVIDPSQLSDSSVTYDVRVGSEVLRTNMKDMFQKLTFSEQEWRLIAQRCTDTGLQFFATVDHLSGVDLLERLEVPVHKMGAWDVTYRQLVEHIAKTGKPMFLDLGPATQAEIDAVVGWFREAGGGPLLFMHDFHTTVDSEMNLRAISYLNGTYKWPAGFSSPARDDDLDVAAVVLGAHHIEKRLILSRSERAYHAHESLQPEELKNWVERIRHVERALGVEAIRPTTRDREQSALYYRSACTLRAIVKGEEFTPNNLGAKRPGSGIRVDRLSEFWGRRCTRDLPANTLISEDHIE